MTERRVPDNIIKLIRKWYTGPDSCSYVRARLRLNHEEWASLTDAHVERAYRKYSAPRKDETRIDPLASRAITLAGPAWSWPNTEIKYA